MLIWIWPLCDPYSSQIQPGWYWRSHCSFIMQNTCSSLASMGHLSHVTSECPITSLTALSWREMNSALHKPPSQHTCKKIWIWTWNYLVAKDNCVTKCAVILFFLVCYFSSSRSVVKDLKMRECKGLFSLLPPCLTECWSVPETKLQALYF